jgi:Probable zinc-ribbon domain
MKRALEKSRAAIARNLIPCNPAAVEMGTSWGSPPKHWLTTTQACYGCQASFEVTASEKQYWFETLGIPFAVQIVYCLECRKKSRAQRRIVNRLAELAPLVDKKQVDELELREFVLVIAEGTVRRARARYATDEDWVLPGHGVLLKGCEAIKGLLRARQPQRDLLPILAHFHQRLGNAERMRRINHEIQQIRQTNPKTAKKFDIITAWMQAPTKKRLQRIISPQR